VGGVLLKMSIGSKKGWGSVAGNAHDRPVQSLREIAHMQYESEIAQTRIHAIASRDVRFKQDEYNDAKSAFMSYIADGSPRWMKLLFKIIGGDELYDLIGNGSCDTKIGAALYIVMEYLYIPTNNDTSDDLAITTTCDYCQVTLVSHNPVYYNMFADPYRTRDKNAEKVLPVNCAITTLVTRFELKLICEFFAPGVVLALLGSANFAFRVACGQIQIHGQKQSVPMFAKLPVKGEYMACHDKTSCSEAEKMEHIETLEEQKFNARLSQYVSDDDDYRDYDTHDDYRDYDTHGDLDAYDSYDPYGGHGFMNDNCDMGY
jgi:hypothetical protein